MAYYHKLGKFPQKKHTTFYKEDGKSLYREELFSTLGFSGVYANKYHIHLPTALLSEKQIDWKDTELWNDAPLTYHHFFTNKKQTTGNFFTARNTFLKNNHCIISTANVTENSDDFFRNAYAHEYIFIHHGKGELLTEYGRLPFIEGDQLVIPKGTTYQLNFSSFENNRILIVESSTAYEIPKHYRSELGQILEHVPYSERDFKLPEYLEPIDQNGEYRLVLKAWDKMYEYLLPHHPFDVVGWDGYLYPYSFNINDFCPIVGKIHLPPPIHLLFTTQHFVLCNFVPRLYDFHPQAIPAPYFHSNIDSDEVLYYVKGSFMSRKGIKEGSITLHPTGLPHGPQPGRTEASIGKKETNECAVMIDTFEPLQVTMNVKDTLDTDYPRSWLEEA